MENTLNNWKNEFKDNKFRFGFLFVVIIFPLAMFSMSQMLHFVEDRQNIRIADPILSLFTPVDLTWFTFILIYGGIVLLFVHLFKYPRILLLAFLSAAVSVILRMCTLYLTPFQAPETIIPLIDPTVAFFGGGRTFLNDLFFSGHTSSMFILFLNSQTKVYRNIFLLGTILTGSAVIIQHVHYSVDVFAAPFFGFAAYIFSKRILNRLFDFNV